MRRVLGFVVVGLALFAAVPARAAETIALLPLELAGGLEANRVDLEAAVVKGLAVAGRRVVLPAEDQRAATYQVSARISRIESSFEVRMQLRRTGGNELDKQENRCDVTDCSVAELARRSARELVRQGLSRAGEVPSVAPPVTAPVEPAHESKRAFPTLGAATAGAGAAAIVAGIYFLAVDGKCTSTVPDHTCKDLHDTKALGIASLAGGAVLGGLGVYLIVHEGKSDGTTVAVGVRRSGLLLTGRF